MKVICNYFLLPLGSLRRFVILLWCFFLTHLFHLQDCPMELGVTRLDFFFSEKAALVTI